jgi:hypothetical protein
LKRTKLTYFFVGAAVLLVSALILKESFFQQEKTEFQGKFLEIGYYRNENNTGPVLRIYAIQTSEKDPKAMSDFASTFPHTKYGRTLVFFFSEQQQATIPLQAEAPHFPALFYEYLIASYEKTPLGESRFQLVKP